FLGISGWAQSSSDHQVYLNTDVSNSVNEPPTSFYTPPKQMIRLFGTVGAVYDKNELSAMPLRNINKIAGLSLGVDCMNGGTPIIRGAEGGTAYFVDGVRVRSGSLGIAGYGF
ncbi:MAG: hypothetical protein ACOVP1_13790, partial [Bacteroidia bacterium]